MKNIILSTVFSLSFIALIGQKTIIATNTKFYTYNALYDEWTQTQESFNDTSYFEFKKGNSEILHLTKFGAKKFTFSEVTPNDNGFELEMQNDDENLETLKLNYVTGEIELINNISFSKMTFTYFGIWDNEY